MMFMVAATLLFSLGPILIRMGINHGIDPDQLMVLRLAVASPLFLIALLVGRSRAEAVPLIKEMPFVLLLSIGGMGGAMFCFFRSISYLGASVATLVGAITPMFTVILAYLIHSRPVKRVQVASTALSFAGIALLMAPLAGLKGMTMAVSPSLAGLAYALMANLCAAATALGFERYVKVKSPLVASAHVTIIMFVFFAAFSGFPRPVFDASTWVIILLLGSVTWFFPFVLYFHGIRAMGASNAVLVQNAGPMATVGVATAMLGERLTIIQLGGMGVIITSVYLLKGMHKKGGKSLNGDGEGAVTLPEG